MSLENSGTRPFRFCDLPPELRNRIYSHVFEDEGPNEIDILVAHAHIPSAAIVLASHQLHDEVAGLRQQAVREFWNNHQFHVSLNKDVLSGKKFVNSVMTCLKVSAHGLRRLEIRYGPLRAKNVPTLHHAMVLEDGGVVTVKEWVTITERGYNMPDSESTACRSDGLQLLATRNHVSLSASAPATGLDVATCVRVGCEYGMALKALFA